jgi:hypothetical protein
VSVVVVVNQMFSKESVGWLVVVDRDIGTPL